MGKRKHSETSIEVESKAKKEKKEEKKREKKEEMDEIDVEIEQKEKNSTTTLATKTTMTDADTAREKHAKDIQQRRTLFVRSLPYTVTSAMLSEKFSFIAPIKHATVVIDPKTNTSRGFGFVTFTDAMDAQRAVKELGDTVFEGRKIKIELAEPRRRQTATGAVNSTGEAAIGASENTSALPTPVAVVRKGAQGDKDVKRRSPRLIIRNLPWSVQKPEQLIKVFQSYGKVKDVIIPKKRTGEMSGFAFVTMKGYKNAERAIGKTNGIEIDGRTVAVDWAVEKEEWEAKMREQRQNEEPKKLAISAGEEEEEGESDDNGEDDEMEVDNDCVKGGDDDDEVGGDEDDDEMDKEGDWEDEDQDGPPPTDSTTTLFIRNLPYSATDDVLYEHFSQFGPVHYSRVVVDPSSDRPKGTGFVCFYDPEITSECLKGAPRNTVTTSKDNRGKPSLLESESLDPSGRYTLDGRTLALSRAVDKSEANRLATLSSHARDNASSDNRRLYLLQEGTIAASCPAFAALSPSERLLREQSRDQRKRLLNADPNLHLSLTRLSVRNIPRWVTSKDLKAFARKAIPGFAEDMNAGLRAPLSKEELARDGGEGKAAEEARRRKGVGVVKQAKIQLENAGGRSRGYGFVEYWSHRYALMGLRWLNGHLIPGHPPPEDEAGDKKRPRIMRGAEVENKKRLVVEFAIENAKVVHRRQENEVRSKEIGEKRRLEREDISKRKRNGCSNSTGNKRKWGTTSSAEVDKKKLKVGKREGWNQKKPKTSAIASIGVTAKITKQAPQEQEMSSRIKGIIQKKRMIRKAKGKGKGK